ncbi:MULTISPECIES: preprotein translocase subunit YajC [unclassified Arthrobacter]|uniref:preprotein translocase subunit YajC n=1 Tax=unclassified Arthrobacter TaxID=235627 RepID=UPI0024DF34C5|nr:MULTISPECIES: preprotein translocase subunit YajC [unclassified Arthrobacter]MCC9145560.1 preprotein translocase subunit YajC [Arthrobacter sp. zg-Y919]MDK1276789.1 preprotein translocase subunit YajC [Arthrobacter sp. zg.Y919]WIB04271.1 preprotein translocase subunit YajC [Arthrobacter sp. zg-Y919]
MNPADLFIPLLLAVFVIMMFRKQKKTTQSVAQQRAQMLPGTEVMTQFGLFGRIVSVDQEENKAVLELSPGNTATVHLQALTKVVTVPAEEKDEEEAAPVEGATVVPDDASSLTLGKNDDAARDSAQDETPEETLKRLNRDDKKEN